MEKLVLDRVSCHVTANCNLRCNKCSDYIPELHCLPNITIYTLEQMKNSFKVYFEMVESVRMISLSGGEPFLFSELDKLVDFLLTYEDRFEKLEIFTNGTLPIPNNLLHSASKSAKVSFLIDNYGPYVSTQVNTIETALKHAGISFKTRKYYDFDAHMNGWHDYGLSNGKKVNADEAKFRYEKCYGGKNGNMLCTIFGTHLFLCQLAEVGRRIGRIPLNDTLFIDLSDETTSIEEKLNQFRSILSVDYNPACAYCNGIGVYENEPRYTPGKQLTNIEDCLVTKKVIELINAIRPYEKITETSELIKSGILDSLAVISLIAHLEDCFDIEIADDMVTETNFANAKSIMQVVMKSKKSLKE